MSLLLFCVGKLHWLPSVGIPCLRLDHLRCLNWRVFKLLFYFAFVLHLNPILSRESRTQQTSLSSSLLSIQSQAQWTKLSKLLSLNSVR